MSSVYVSGYKAGTTIDDLIIYFQSKESGGGDIEEESCKLEGEEAVIVFDEEQDKLRVLEKDHSLDGCTLTVLPTSSKTKIRQSKVTSSKKRDIPLEPDEKADKKPKVGEIRTVIVSGICPQTTNSTLELFFENQRRTGGGDIERLERFESEVAQITFCSAQVASRVLKKGRLEVDGYLLELKAKKTEISMEPDKKADKKPKVGEIRTVIVSGICPQTTNNTLELFFENQRRSGGGDIERLERFEPQVAHITFCSAQVASSVLKAERLEVDGYLLELEAKKPDVIFPPDKKKLLVENVDPETSKDSLLNYVEVVTGLNVGALEFGKKKNAIVTLDKEPDMDKVNKKAKNKRLEGAVLKITHPPVCNSILVTGLSENTTKDAIELKFENPRYGGGEILDVVYHENEGKAVISFLDPNVIDSVTAKEHCLNGSTLVVCPYYPLLEDDADMMERNKLKIIPVTQDVMHHVSNRCDEEFSRVFGFSIMDAKYDEEKEELVFTVTRKLAEKIDNIQRYFSQFTVTEIAVSKKLITDSKQEVEEILTKVKDSNKNIAHATLDGEKQCIVVTGKKKKVEKLTKNLQHELEVLERKKEVVTRQISIDPYKLMFIYSLGFKERFDSEPDIDVKIDTEKGVLTAKGSQSQVDSAKLQALEELSKIKEDYIELNERQEQYFQSRGLIKINQDLKKKNVNAHVCLDKSKPGKARVELFYSEKYDKVERLVMEEASEERYTVEEESVQLLNSEKWTEMKPKLENVFDVMITARNEDVNVWLTGKKNQVQQARESLEQFVKINTIVCESIVLSDGIHRYLSKFCAEKIKTINETQKKHMVRLKDEDGKFILQGTKEGVKEAKIMLQRIIDGLAQRTVLVEQPGMQKFLKSEAGKTSLRGLESENRCSINLTNNREGKSMQVRSLVQQPTITSSTTLLCTYETPEKILLKVHQGDITNHQCDVIVNAANGDLKHIGGLALDIVNKGGREIQEDCDAYVRKNRSLCPGECYKGISGKLPFKYIIHAVGPRWNNADRVRHKELLQYACENSLESAKNDTTIALPAVGSGIFGVPKDLCAHVMVEAALKFSSKNGGKCRLREIHFVNNDTTTAQTFLREFRKRFADKPRFNEKQSKPNLSRHSQNQSRSNGRHDSEEIPRSTVSTAAKRQQDDSVQTNISVVIGDLSTQEADVLVNTTSEDLQLNNNPCGRALSNQAGPTLQHECNQIGRLKAGELALTGGGNLRCKHVYHVVCVQYNKGQGEKVLRKIIRSCLEQSHSQGLKSIAFPAIGTGVLGFPHNVTAKICFEEAKKFGKNYPNTSLNEIRFVVYHQDQASIKAFQDESDRLQSTSRGPSRRERRKPVEDSGESSTSSPIIINEDEGITVFVQEKVTIQVLKGDITQERTDVIAHLSNSEMSMQSGVAKAILREGGDGIRKGIKKHAKAVPMYSTVLTTAGKLQARHIAHMAAPDGPSSKDIGKSITNCLQEITDRGHTSISFPAIATGQLSMSPEESAQAMLTAIVEFVQAKPGTLNTFRIVIQDKEVFPRFLEAVKRLFSGENDQSPGIFRTIINSVLNRINFWKSDSGLAEKSPGAKSPKPQLFLEICAEKPKIIDQVRETIDKMTEQQMKKEIIEDEQIEKLSAGQESQIMKIGQENNIEVKIEKPIKRIIVNGHVEDISVVLLEINKILSKVKIAEHEKDTAEMVSQNVKWSWLDTDGSEVDYDVSINSMIEKAHSKKAGSVTFQLTEGKCEIFFDKMEEINHKTGEKTKVFRKDLKAKADISVPDYWDPQPKDTNGKELPVHLVQLDPNKDKKEYKKISDGFYQSAPRQTIKMIRRIQNPALYKLYALKKQSMDERDGSNERLLYHGTASNNISVINQNGLNRSYTGLANGTAYGRGIYFATNASMSVGYASADASGDRYMYVARVAVGDYTQGSSSMIVPPNKHANTPYDSVVDNMTSPTIFVLFYDNQYYPEYLITFC